MESKFSILLVFTIVAQSALALGSTNSCKVSTIGVEADLAKIEFGRDTALLGLNRTNDQFYIHMETILEKCTLGTKTTTKGSCCPDDKNAIDETVTSLMIGIYPVLYSIRTMHPDFNVQAGHNRSYTIIVEIVNNFFHALRLTCSDENRTKGLSEIEIKQNAAELGARSLIGNMFIGIRRGANFSPDEESLMVCAQQSITSKILGAFRVIFYAIKILWAQLNNGTPAGSEKCLLAIKAAHKESAELFAAEVCEKYDAIVNLREAIFLNEVGTVPGLFALKSIQAKP